VSIQSTMLALGYSVIAEKVATVVVMFTVGEPTMAAAVEAMADLKVAVVNQA